MLKNLALMGVGTEGSGKVVVTDMDRIERSNLSRQFLFRNSDIGKSKSETAVKAIKRMNPAMQCEHFEVKVCPESEDIFSDSFFEGGKQETFPRTTAGISLHSLEGHLAAASAI